jgi:hypothetical protein
MVFQSNGYKHEGVEAVPSYVLRSIYRRRLVETGKFFEEFARVLTTI